MSTYSAARGGEQHMSYSQVASSSAPMAVRLAGLRVDLCERDYVLNEVHRRLSGRNTVPLFLASANLDHIHHFKAASGRSDLFAATADSEWLVLPDGMPVVWTVRRLTGQRWAQLAGADLLPDLLDVAACASARVGFLGGTPEMHARLATVLQGARSGVTVAGYWAPPRQVLFNPRASGNLAADIRSSQVDLLVVSLGKPRQEQWLAMYGVACGVRAAAAFGAASDFLAGTSPRAPRPLRRAGLEWMYRLVREPRRLWRRYLVEGVSTWLRLYWELRVKRRAMRR